MKKKTNFTTTIITIFGAALSVVGGIIFFVSYDLHHFRPPTPFGAYALYALTAVSMGLGLFVAIAVIIYQKFNIKNFVIILLSILTLAFLLGTVLLWLLLFYARIYETPTLIMTFFMSTAYLLSIIFLILTVKSHVKTNSNVLADEICEGDKKI